MVNYVCKPCGFKSNRKTDYTRHVASRKHSEKVDADTITHLAEHEISPTAENVYTCPNCHNNFSRGSSLSRHKKTCMENLLKEKDNIIQHTEIDTLKKQMQMMQEQLSVFTTLVKSTTINQSGSKPAITSINYVINNYNDAPPLTKLLSYDHMLESKTQTIVDIICMYHESNTLDKFIGDFIIKSYKKTDHKKQSMWNTDSSRFTYLIKEFYETGKSSWVIDKRGVKTQECIIQPVLDYLKDTLKTYVEEELSQTRKTGVFKQRTATAGIVLEILGSGKLGDDIIKYIAPFFYLNKDGPVNALTEK